MGKINGHTTGTQRALVYYRLFNRVNIHIRKNNSKNDNIYN